MECSKVKIGISYSGPGAKVIGNGVLWGTLMGLFGTFIGYVFGKPREGAFWGTVIGSGIGAIRGYKEELEG